MKAIGKLVLGALMLAGTAVAMAPAAEAQGYYGGGYGHGPGYGRPGAHFSFGSGPSWRSGRWVHGWHGARQGWWWTVGNSWYLYPRPVYPYPVYAAPGFAGDDGYTRRSYAPTYEQVPDRNPQRPNYWYFCQNPEGYYPYIQDCDDWQQEPAQGAVPPGDYPEYRDEDFQRDQ